MNTCRMCFNRRCFLGRATDSLSHEEGNGNDIIIVN